MTNQPDPTTRDRINIDQKHHAFYQEHTNTPDAPLRTMKDLFMLAASIGYSQSRRIPISSQQNIFDWAVFTPQNDVPVLRAIAIAATGDTQILNSQDETLTLLEEYANGGIEYLKGQLNDQPPQLKLLSLVQYVIEGPVQ